MCRKGIGKNIKRKEETNESLKCVGSLSARYRSDENDDTIF